MAAKLGQHFLQDSEICKRMADYAGVMKDDVVLEIGPGKGVLTEELVGRAGKVIAIEKDRVLARIVRDNFPAAEVITGDCLKIEWPAFDKCVSNLPYQISGPVTFKLFEHRWKTAVLMFQSEFAERFVAEPGSRRYSRLTVAVNYHCDAEILELVPKEKFTPRPKVSSAIVRLTPKKPPFQADEHFWQTVAALFRHKKKTVAAALRASRHKNLGKVPQELAKERVFMCGLEDMKRIADSLA
ncbi:MAG: 16S rRNA (adenine(1518)-N(6)/adenine(1519)-N(6))-dimethyltransferase RsmA [Candidatus Aenigmatarchaeota archaeon]